MTQAYSTESVQEKLHALALSFAEHFARALVALLTGRKISAPQVVSHRMPGEQNPEANRQQMRRCLEHESLRPQTWTRAIAALIWSRADCRSQSACAGGSVFWHWACTGASMSVNFSTP